MTPAALRPFPDAGLPVLPRRSPHGRFREGRGKAATFHARGRAGHPDAQMPPANEAAPKTMPLVTPPSK